MPIKQTNQACDISSDAEVPQRVQVLAPPLAYPPEVDEKTLLLKKAQCTLVTRNREIKPYLNQKLPFCCLDFKILKGAIQVAGGERHKWFYPAVHPMKL